VNGGGQLVIKNSHALGSGDLNLLDGTLRADPMMVYVGGNFLQGTNGTLLMAVNGAGTNDFDQLNIAGNATVDGTLHVYTTVTNYTPQHADRQALLVASNGVIGTFATFTNEINHSPMLFPELVYGSNSVTLTWAQLSFVITNTLTHNQRSVALALNSLASSTATADVALLNFLDYVPDLTNNLPLAYDLIAPEELASIFTVAFAGADADGKRFLNRVSYLATGYRNEYAKLVASVNQAKTAQSTAATSNQPASDRWDVYVEGVVESASVRGDANGEGYDQSGGGLSIGADTWVNEKLVLGVAGTYAPATVDFSEGGKVDVESLRGQCYAVWLDRGLHLEGTLGGGLNSYDSDRQGLLGKAKGSTDGTEFYLLFGGGYEWQKGNWSAGPQANFQYTTASIDGFKEKGSSAPLRISSQSEEALHTQLGLRVRYLGYVKGTWTFFTPELQLGWRHDFNDSVALGAKFASGAGNAFTVTGPKLGQDSFVGGLGITMHWTRLLSSFFQYTGQVGQSGYDSHVINGGLALSF
jgi:outer membrane autotransporter protein